LTTENFNEELPEGNIQEVYDQVEERINDVMKKCFRKCKIKKHNEVRSMFMDKYKTITQFAKKGKIQRKIAKIYIQEILKLNTAEVAESAKERVKDTLQKLTIDNKFSPNNFWELCRKSKINSTNSTSIETAEGNELFGDEVISEAYLNEFVHRLRKRQIIPELENYEERTKQICQYYLEEAKRNIEPPYSNEEYQQVRKKLKKDMFMNVTKMCHFLIRGNF
jgi:hypothetical protein